MTAFHAMQHSDWQTVKEIYEEGIATGNATFHQTVPEWEDWNKNHLQHSRIVAKEGETILGWAALTPVSARKVYAGVAEVSVYITSKCRGIGAGKRILQKLVEASEANGIWTLQAIILTENIASIKIHEANGFRLVGYREKIGQMDGVWRDTILMERRSKIIGV